MYKRERIRLDEYKIVETVKADLPTDEIKEDELEDAIVEVDDIGEYEETKTQAELINEAVEQVDVTIREAFLDNVYFNDLLKQLHSSNWNNKTPKERREIFLSVHGYTSYMFGEEIIKSKVAFTDRLIDEECIYIEDGETYVYDKVFESKNSGISILANYIYAFAKDLIISVPRGTLVKDAESGKIIADISTVEARASRLSPCSTISRKANFWCLSTKAI